MLYYIFRFLEQFNIPGAHLWSYISFRSLLALILSLVISAWFGEYFIKWMKRRKIFETERDPSIDPFGVEKKGVPTMGGIIIIVAILVPVILLGRMRNIYLILMIVTTLWLGFLGFHCHCLGSAPGQGTEILQATWRGNNNNNHCYH